MKSLFITFCSSFIRLRLVLFEGDRKVEGSWVSEASVNYRAVSFLVVLTSRSCVLSGLSSYLRRSLKSCCLSFSEMSSGCFLGRTTFLGDINYRLECSYVRVFSREKMEGFKRVGLFGLGQNFEWSLCCWCRLSASEDLST